jgi:phytoene dehydrogenase-like protein
VRGSIGGASARVIVVGAGSNGLVAAIHLARAGLQVTVLEHGPTPGGASSSVAATLPGFVHDHCAGFNPMSVASPALAELGLENEGLRWVVPDRVMAHPFLDGTAITLDRELEATAASLEGVAPGAGAAWLRFAEPHLQLVEPLVAAVLSPLLSPGPGLRLLAQARAGTPRLAMRMLASVRALGEEIFAGAQRPGAWLAASAQHSGLPPSTAGSGAFGLLLQLLGHSHGWPFPCGGQQRLADALVAIASREGVEIRCGEPVERIVVRRGRVRGVATGGGTLSCGAVLSTVSAHPLLAMLPEGLPPRLRRRLGGWRHLTGAFKLDYALREPVPWSAPDCRSAGVVHVAGELAELTRAAEAGRSGRVPEHPALVVGQHTLFDPTRAPAGRHTLYVYAQVPCRHELPDEEVVSRVEGQLERFAPGFAGVVLARAMRSPAMTEAENPSLVGGDLSGGSMELDQQLFLRPSPAMCRYRTPVDGLYVCGASVHPGGSVHGMSGRSAARALIADRRLRPWRAPARA